MQDIAEWLGRLGLGQYAQRFAENEIDVSVLPHLTDQDLKDIGIPLGHRRKILAAISEPAVAAQGRTRTLCCFNSAEDPGRGGAPSGYRYVRRPGRLDGTLGTYGP